MKPVVSLNPPKRSSKTALEQIEYAVGGRDAVIDTLGLATLDKKQQHFLDLLCDPKRARHTIDSIARDSGLTPFQVLELFRNASFAKAQAVAMARMSDVMPAIVDDMAAKSVDAKIECPTCFGAKKIGDPKIDCPYCMGKGLVLRVSDIDRQKIILESTGVTKKGTGGVNVQVNTQVNSVAPGNFFSSYVKASDKAAYDVIDAESVDVNDPTSET